MQRIVTRKIEMKDGTIVPVGASVPATTNPKNQKLVLIVYNDKVYNVEGKYFEEVEKSGHYCKFCQSHDVEYEYHKLDGRLQLIIGCHECGRVYEAYNEAV